MRRCHPERAERGEGSAPSLCTPACYPSPAPLAHMEGSSSPHLPIPSSPRMDHFIALQSALAGEYSLDREIGRGGMGIVYLAREVRLARPVAIKVLPPALAERPELREAFLREAQTAAALTHPNIVPVYAVGER